MRVLSGIPEIYDFFLYLIFSRPGVSSNFSARAVHTANDARLQPEVPLFGHNWSPTRDEAFDGYFHANFHTNTKVGRPPLIIFHSS